MIRNFWGTSKPSMCNLTDTQSVADNEYNDFMDKMETRKLTDHETPKTLEDDSFLFKIPNVPERRKVNRRTPDCDFEVQTLNNKTNHTFKVPGRPNKINVKPIGRSKGVQKMNNFHRYKMKNLQIRLPLRCPADNLDILKRLHNATRCICDFAKKSTRQEDYIAILITSPSLRYGRLWMPFTSLIGLMEIHIWRHVRIIGEQLKRRSKDDDIVIRVYIAHSPKEFNEKNQLTCKDMNKRPFLIVRDDDLNIPRCLIHSLEYAKGTAKRVLNRY